VTKFVDQAVIFGARVTSEGYLVADCHVARAGVQRYSGRELGLPEAAIVDVYRPVESVFSPDSLQSFSHIPVTLDHPSEPVSSDNWKELAVGEVSSDVLRDGERLKIPLVLKDARAIDFVASGKRQLSVGYSAELDIGDGVAPDGTPYQAIQRHIRANHVAIVDRARAGDEFRIGDSLWGVPLGNSEPGGRQVNLKSVLVDGITIQTTDQGAEALSRLQGELRDQATELASSLESHRTAILAKDSEIGELKAKLADAEKRVPSSLELDALARARADLIAQARGLSANLQIDGLSDSEIKRAAVLSLYGDELVRDSSEAEISGMFKAALGNRKGDPVRGAFSDLRAGQSSREDNGQGAYEARLRDAWKAA